MNVDISPEGEQFIESVVENGGYRDHAAVIEEALRLMRERLRRLEQLRNDVEAGIQSGEAIPGNQVVDELEGEAQSIAKRNRAVGE